MANANAEKGKRAERAVVDYLKGRGFRYAERSRAGWTEDRGDIDGIPGVCLEVKDAQAWRRDEWLAELACEVAHRGVNLGAVIVKRRGTSDVGQWYVLMPAAGFVDLLQAATE